MKTTTAALEKPLMLYSMPNLPDEKNDSWMYGSLFHKEPEEPIIVEIREGFEDGDIRDYFDNPPIVSQIFLEALIEVGIDNIVAYDVVLESEDQTVRLEGYKAINIVGLVKAAGPGTVYMGDIRSLNASIEKLAIEPRSINGLYMFRMAENVSKILVHEKVKNHLESKNFVGLYFQEADGALLL